MAKQRSRKRPAPTRATETAQFVFRGTVTQRGAVTFDEVPMTRDSLIVRVDEILDGPPVLAGFAGAEITVQLSRGQKVNTGKSYVFYTNGWMYGAGLAVKCVAVKPDTDLDLRESRQAIETAPERALRERAGRAEMVVTGRVTEIREAPRLPKAPITEHDPEWRRAVIAVEEVPQEAPAGRKRSRARARGRGARQVVIRFAASPDVRWATAPKFSVGDAGVWFLGERTRSRDMEAVRAAAGAAADEYVVVDPEDFLPHEFAERVMTILNR